MRMIALFLLLFCLHSCDDKEELPDYSRNPYMKIRFTCRVPGYRVYYSDPYIPSFFQSYYPKTDDTSFYIMYAHGQQVIAGIQGSTGSQSSIKYIGIIQMGSNQQMKAKIDSGDFEITATMPK